MYMYISMFNSWPLTKIASWHGHAVNLTLVYLTYNICQFCTLYLECVYSIVCDYIVSGMQSASYTSLCTGGMYIDCYAHEHVLIIHITGLSESILYYTCVLFQRACRQKDYKEIEAVQSGLW